MTKQIRRQEETARVVLEGVPRVNFYSGGNRCPEDVPFPSCLRACLEFMGDSYGCRNIKENKSNRQIDCAYVYIMGTSGAAFRLLWNSTKWDGGNVDIIFMAANPVETFRRAFESVGYEHKLFFQTSYAQRLFLKQDDHYDEAFFRNRIIESIRDSGRPVIAFGVIGPPECCLITGYDEHGDILIGWNYFQGMTDFNAGVEFEPLGYFRKRDWYKDTSGLIIIGDKRDIPRLDEIYGETLKWALEIVRTPRIRDYHGGLAAYTAWSEFLLRDEDFPLDNMALLNERHIVHSDAVSTVAEGRWYASLFLAEIARHKPNMAEELLMAAACYAAEHDLMWKIWGLVGGIGWDEAKVRKLAEPTIRRQIVPLILQARDKDAEGADHIERALAK